MVLKTFLFCCVLPLPNIHRPEPFFNEQPCVCDYFVLLVPTVAEEKISFHSNFFCLKDKNSNLLISAVGSLFGHGGQPFVESINFSLEFFGFPKKVVLSHFLISCIKFFLNLK